MRLALLLTAILAGQATATMQADVDRLVAHAKTLTRVWPWQPAIPEVDRVVRHGKRVAPLLLALLTDDPDRVWDPERPEHVQQQAAIALCRLYGVQENCGYVYCNRASREENQGVKKFWSAKIAEETARPSQPESKQLDSQIGPADAQEYRSIRDGKDWMNPILVIRADGIEVTARGVQPRTVPSSELARALADLPVSAWPHGRVVVVQEIGIRAADRRDDRPIANNLAATLEILKTLRVIANRWPSR